MPYSGICVRPTTINITDITTNSAKVSWSEGYAADSMQVRFAKNSGSGNTTQLYTTTSSYVLTDLLPGTTYNARVRPWCNGVATNGFTAKYFFTTSGLRIAGENDSELPLSVTVFPNPTNGSFQIKIDNSMTDIISLNIIDLAGKNIYENNYTLDDQSLIVPDINLSSGLYIIKISNEQTPGKFIRLVVL